MMPRSRSQNVFALAPGLALRAGATVFCVCQIENGVVTLENVASLHRKTILISVLLSHLGKGTVVRAQEDANTHAPQGNKGVTNRKFRERYTRDRAEHPLEVLEVDDGDTCMFLIDERNGLPFGRGNWTAIIDQHSAAVMGMEMSKLPRSSITATAALVNAILAKDPAHPTEVSLTPQEELTARLLGAEPDLHAFWNSLEDAA